MLRPLVVVAVPALGATLCAQTQFEARTPVAVQSSWPQEAIAADVDGDGDQDLLVCVGLFGGMPGRRLLRNDGGETFTDVTATALPPQPATMMSNGRAVAFDFEGDGDVDVFSSMLGSVAVWRNLGTGTFVDTGFVDTGGYQDLVAADLDGDGDLDVATAGQSLAGSTNTVFVNQGNGSFLRANVLPGTWAIAIAADDLDGDLDQDLLLGTTTGLVVLRNQGGLAFADASAAWVGPLVPGVIRDIVVGDLDGDGDRDVVVARQGVASDDVLVHTGTAFAAGPSLPTGSNGSGRLALADIDEDGDLDLWRGGAAGIDLMLGNGLGGFTSGASRMGVFPGQTPSLLAFDGDRDGDLDLLTGDAFLAPVLLVNRHRDLRPAQPVIGQPWTPVVWSQPGYANGPHFTGLAVATGGLPQPFPLPPYGDIAIDLNTAVVFSGTTSVPGYSASFALAIPAQPQLVGLQLFVQGIVAPPAVAPRFTASFVRVVQ
ncbi:MAG: VCBS repeat-containing protein [Planctomycetes bacterium]|nr:VCBS repeat-containing protein [Planctomycetota bacterium]